MNNQTLFGAYQISNLVEFENMINTITKEQSIYFLVQSVNYAHKKGIFNLEECEVISKSIRKLYLPENQPMDLNEKRDD